MAALTKPLQDHLSIFSALKSVPLSERFNQDRVTALASLRKAAMAYNAAVKRMWEQSETGVGDRIFLHMSFPDAMTYPGINLEPLGTLPDLMVIPPKEGLPEKIQAEHQTVAMFGKDLRRAYEDARLYKFRETERAFVMAHLRTDQSILDLPQENIVSAVECARIISLRYEKLDIGPTAINRNQMLQDVSSHIEFYNAFVATLWPQREEGESPSPSVRIKRDPHRTPYETPELFGKGLELPVIAAMGSREDLQGGPFHDFAFNAALELRASLIATIERYLSRTEKIREDLGLINQQIELAQELFSQPVKQLAAPGVHDSQMPQDAAGNEEGPAKTPFETPTYTDEDKIPPIIEPISMKPQHQR